MFLITFRRILKAGWMGFWRNKWLSSAAILIMTLTVIGISTLLLINVLVVSLAENLEDKIDISIYFDLSASEKDILAVRSELIQMEEVSSVEYISTEEALKRFKDKHEGDEVLIQSLNELGSNPLEASLNVKAQQASQYETIAGFFENKYEDLVDKINYTENKDVIARLSAITGSVRRVGFVILLIMSISAILVTFNTIRLTIYSVRKEIKVMKLVGASNWFAQGPFLIEGALYGIVAAVIAILVLYPLLWYVSPAITKYLSRVDIFYYFKSHILVFVLIQFGTGVALGIISSLLAVRRYLDV